jgi:hypothetical protein
VVTVDTSACKFTKRPLYLPVLSGTTNSWTTTGGSDPYVTDATATTQFSIYINAGAAGVSTTNANSYNWRIEWVAIGN